MHIITDIPATRKEFMNKLLTKRPRYSELDNELDDYSGSKNTLGYFVQQKTVNQYTVNLDEPFIEPSYYRGIVQMLMNSTEEDTVIFLLNSPGGALNGLVALLEGINMSEANTLAVIIGECQSAASIFALHCDQIFVSDNATMLAHNVSYGTGGKGSDILSHVQHVSKTSEKLLRKTYEHFLDQQEINEMINGREIYLDADEIKQRLDNRDKILEELEALEQAEADKPMKAPSRSKKTPKTTST